MKLLTKLTFLLVIAVGVTFSANAQDMEDEKPTIVELATQTNSLTTLVQGVKAADLVETLNSEGPFTVFAPTNDAFTKLPDGTLTSLLQPENKDKLASILTYHVVPGKIMSSDLEDGQWVETVQGNRIKISLSDSGAMVNKAGVAQADIEASNGVVHVIDSVILPSDNEEDKMEEDNGY